MTETLQPIRLEDYQPPSYLVDHVDLQVELAPEQTLVQATLQMRVNPALQAAPGPLCLHGRHLELLEIELDGQPVGTSEYEQDDETLTVRAVPETFRLRTVVRINPEGNTALEGLYRSNGIYCTQCEAEGFRKVTFYPDRPDVMARFTVTLVADRESCPVLLSNGNKVDSGPRDDDRHFATFEDPFPKPSYLFALVAGDLVAIRDSYTTLSGRDIDLEIYVEERNRNQCAHAMQSLKNAMRWDEETFGLECDLDEYKIVAVDDFNMGAMENKGLNVFNSKYVLAQPETATDVDYQGIEGVIAHEYFHNWTGNRVTCRDWFQLSLKEGLTVFRDQEFSADMGSRAVKRINDVRVLRNAQFPEDAGPMAHPVRPSSYVEINNFYTTTVYNKGAEVIRMYQSLLGVEGFRKGVALYLDRHDGQAVTTDDFLAAMAEANNVDLCQLQRWYDQAGTPLLEISGQYDENASEFHLHIRQMCPETPGQPDKQPFLIPVKVGLLGPDGKDMPLQLAGESTPGSPTRVLKVTVAEQTFSFVNMPVSPVPSLLRDFSAPVRSVYPYDAEQLAFLFANDSDPFNRWEAGQRLATDVLLEMIADIEDGWQAEAPEEFFEAFREALVDKEADPALLALALTLPSETELFERMDVADPPIAHEARTELRTRLSHHLHTEFADVMARMQDDGFYEVSAEAIGRRSLKNLCLNYLVLLDDPLWATRCFEQFVEAGNMTDRISALAGLVHNGLPRHEEALEAFYHQFQDDPLVVDKWFTLQATSPREETLDQVQCLMGHPAFTMTNPNRVRSLVGAFAMGNPARFHDRSGAGYRFLSDQVIALDPLNPHMAARLVGVLGRWQRYDDTRQELMCNQLERIQRQPGLSRDVGEIVQKSLVMRT